MEEEVDYVELHRQAFSTLVYNRHSLDHALKQIARPWVQAC